MPSLLLRSLIFTSICSTFFIAPALQAQTVKAEQEKLVQLETEQTNLSNQIKQLEADVAAKQAELATAKAKPAPEKNDLAAVEKELENAKAAYAANPNDMNQTSLKNAEFKRHLAERKYLKSGSSIMDAQGQLQRVENQLASLRNALSSNVSKIDAQKALIVTTEKQAVANAELDKQKAALKKQNAEKQAKASELAAKEQQAAEQQRAIEAAAKTKADQQAAEKLAAEQAAKKAAEDANGPKRLTDKAAVTAELARITTLQESFWSKGKVNQILYLRRDGSDSKSSNTLRDLGHLQYRTELAAPGGKVLLNIGFQKWELTFGNSDVGQAFVFIYDQSNATKPRLVYYPKSLE